MSALYHSVVWPRERSQTDIQHCCTKSQTSWTGWIFRPPSQLKYPGCRTKGTVWPIIRSGQNSRFLDQMYSTTSSNLDNSACGQTDWTGSITSMLMWKAIYVPMNYLFQKCFSLRELHLAGYFPDCEYFCVQIILVFFMGQLKIFVPVANLAQF